MVINFNIKADVSNIKLSEIFDIIALFIRTRSSDKEVVSFNGYEFMVSSNVGVSIDITIVELPQNHDPSNSSDINTSPKD